MKERIVIAAVLMAAVYLGIFSVTTAFGSLLNDAQTDTNDISNSNGNPFSIPHLTLPTLVIVKLRSITTKVIFKKAM